MPAMRQLGSSIGTDMTPYHDSPLRAPSIGNKKDYHLKMDVRDGSATSGVRNENGKHSHMNNLGSGPFLAPFTSIFPAQGIAPSSISYL